MVLPEKLPDRVCIHEDSPYYNSYFRHIGVKLDGKVRMQDVVEYCVSEGWIRHWIRGPNGQIKTERGRYVAVKVMGKVEPYWR